MSAPTKEKSPPRGGARERLLTVRAVGGTVS